MDTVTVALAIVAFSLYYFFIIRNKTTVKNQNIEQKKRNPDPKVFVLHGDSDDHHPIKTGTGLIGLLADDPDTCHTGEGGAHVLDGVLITQLKDYSIVLSSCKTPHHNVLWKSGFLSIGNTNEWHKHDFSALPTKYEHCRAAACVLALDEHGHILLTRRCKHMRTFPSAWVCPGGGMDDGESLAECAARELREETGLIVNASTLVPLALFESFFPTTPEDCFAKGKVGGQHIVCFFTVIIKGNRPMVKLQREEANAYAWMPGNALDLPPSHMVTVNARENGEMVEEHCPIIEITTRYNSYDERPTGLAQAHLFAIQQFTNKQKAN